MPLLLLAYLGFISLGLPDGMLGVAWPHMAAGLQEPIGAVGFVLFAGTAGYLLSSVAAGFTTARLGVGWLLAVSTALAAVALAGFGSAPALPVVVAAALLLGLGSGAIDAGLNAYAARHFGARHMNWLHASYGAGATLGPLVVTTALAVGWSWRAGYGTVSVAQLLLAVAFVVTARAWMDGPGTAVAAAVPGGRILPTLALPRMWLGATAFAVYVAVEAGTGLWAYTLLTAGRGLATELAGVAVSGYWGWLFVGRLLFGVVAERVGVHRVLKASVGTMVAGATLVALPGPGGLAVAGLMVIGLAAAPVFPLLTLTTAERVGAGYADQAIGVQVGASALGATTVPAGIGVLIGRVGPEALGPCLVVLAVLLVVLYLATRRSRPGDGVGGQQTRHVR